MLGSVETWGPACQEHGELDLGAGKVLQGLAALLAWPREPQRLHDWCWAL